MHLSGNAYGALFAASVAVALACSACPSTVMADPNAKLSAAQAEASVASSKDAVDDAVRQYDSAWKRLSAIEASLAESSARLDDLIARQAELQAQLGSRARSMYRLGPLGFLEVLAGSATFNQFITVWDALLRINRQDVATISELRQDEARITQVTESLLEHQAAASRQLRVLEAAKEKARSELAASQTAYAAYKKQIAAREAQLAASARQSTSAPPPVQQKGATQPTGSGAWKTAVASHYGTGTYGIRLSSGVTIGPDSMIVAHKTLPFGTLVEFSHRGRIAVAKVADRGPYTQGREWDLGPGTARVLGFRGVNKVSYRIIGR